jgi:hypothetical protein
MAKKSSKKGDKTQKKRTTARKSKSEEELECFYCGGLVRDWNWRCPHCKKLFSSGKKAIAFFVVLILISSIIGTYSIWYPKPRKEMRLFIDEVHPWPGNTSSYWFAQPDVTFNLTHVLEIGLDKEACQNAWSISPQIAGEFNWAGWPPYHIMIYAPLDRIPGEDGLWPGWLQPNTTYHVKITKDCKDLEGNHLDKEWDYWFHTTPRPTG